MPYLFTPVPEINPGPQSFGSLLCMVGTLTFSGSYATGGDTAATGAPTLEELLKRIGRGRVMFVDLSRGLEGEWDATAKKLKLYTTGATEMGAGAYAAGYTASPVPCLVLGR